MRHIPNAMQVAYFRAAWGWWGSAAGFIAGGVIAMAGALVFLRAGKRVYVARKGDVEEESGGAACEALNAVEMRELE